MVITKNNVEFITKIVAETLKQTSESFYACNKENDSKADLLSIKEICQKYPALSDSAIRKAIKYQGLKFIKIGKILIDKNDLETFLDKQKTIVNTIEEQYNNTYKLINVPNAKKKYV